MKIIMKQIVAVVLALAVPSASLAQNTRPVKMKMPAAPAFSGAGPAGSMPGFVPVAADPFLKAGPFLELTPALQNPGSAVQGPAPARLSASDPPSQFQESSSVPDETILTKAREGFDGLSRAASTVLYDPGTPSRPYPKPQSEPKPKSRPKALIGLVPALGLAASASAGPVGQAAAPQAQNVFQALAQNPAMEFLAQAGYLVGNYLAFVVDLPRMFEAAQSRNPKAVSIGSNLILLAASLLAGARGFLGLDLLWAWQNVVSGIVPMTIVLLQFEGTKRLFPEELPSRLVSESPEKYSAGAALIRTGALLLIGAPVALGLGLLGQSFLCPLSAHPAVPLARLILQALASAGFVYFLIPQIKKIKETQSIEGVSFWFMGTLMVLCSGLALWAIHGTLSEVQSTLALTLANLDFWNRLIYAGQGLGSVYVTWLTLKVMSQQKP